MAALVRTRRTTASDAIWPGFVDALATLLMVIIFLLTVFVLAQFFLTDLLAGRDQALTRLEIQVAELTQMLTMEREAGAELRSSVTQLSAQLQSSTADRDRLTVRLAEVTATAKKAEANAVRLEAALTAARKEVTVGKETVRLKLAEIASLNADLAALRTLRKELESKVASLAASLEKSDAEKGALRDRTKALEAKLADEAERTRLAQKEIKTARGETTAKAAQVERLNAQIVALRKSLERISAALDASEAESKKQKVEIVNLGKRLNAALASKVEELARYRSEFFGRLRRILGRHRDVRVVGDRFVFQSEVLFDSGSAGLNAAGQTQIRQLATALGEIAREIPKDIEWILRVDGHTDVRPIQTARFPSNWELSTARALTVVRALIGFGIPPKRLAATGFGPYQPIDNGNGEAAFTRNRRIELKFTQR
jgi:chemotaxis protein MotB